jgi:SAM-dependent methyltransferase
MCRGRLSRTIGRVDTKAFDRFEAAGWARRADGYARHFVALTGRVVPDLLDAAGVGPGSRVVDLGSGPGHTAASAAERGARVVGLDVAPEMVAIARGRHPDLTFEVGDAQALPFPDASRDAVVGNFVVLHLGEPERAAAEAARVLAPGGAVALSTWDLPAANRFLGVVVEAITEVGTVPPADLPAGPPFFRFAEDAAFADLLTGAGFGDVRVRTVAFGHRFASTDALWQLMVEATVRTRPMLLGQPEETRAAVERRAAPYVDGDGLLMPVSVKIASGVRG